jgi:hypothetical protein
VCLRILGVAELNPIEGVWALMKRSLREQAAAGADAVSTAAKLNGAVAAAAGAIGKDAMLGLWTRSMGFFAGYEKAMAKEASDAALADEAAGPGLLEDEEVEDP